MTKDKIEILNERLKKTVDAFNDWKKSGIHPDILIAYLKVNTNLTYREIKDVLKNFEDFHSKLIEQQALENLKEE